MELESSPSDNSSIEGINAIRFFGRVISGQSDYWESGEILDGPHAHLGGVVFDQGGQVLLVEPKGHHDGYVWTFPKMRRSKNESPGKAALRAVKEKGGVEPLIVMPLGRNYAGTAGASENFYYVMLHRGIQEAPRSPHVVGTMWARPEQARQLISLSTNLEGQKRDLLVLRGALSSLTCHLSLDDWPGPHGREWFRSDLDLGMGDGLQVTRQKLEAEGAADARIFGTEPHRLLRPIRPRHLPPPTRNFTEWDMDQFRLGILDDRGLVFTEPLDPGGLDENAARLCLYRNRSGLCAYEAILRRGPLGWFCSDLIVDDSIFGSVPALSETPGTDAWESLVFEHIVTNLYLKKLDEALWRRFFDADPNLRF